MNVVVRRGTPDDRTAIAELIEDVDQARFVRTDAQWGVVREQLRKILASEETVTFVAEGNDGLVGELLGVPRSPGVLRIGVSVSERSRRRGIATALFKAAFEWARQAGFRELELEVQEVNTPARTLYEKLGFVDTGKRREGERGPVLTMTTRL
jgi:GNAT superfamily N-acetyltransferase